MLEYICRSLGNNDAGRWSLAFDMLMCWLMPNASGMGACLALGVVINTDMVCVQTLRHVSWMQCQIVLRWDG